MKKNLFYGIMLAVAFLLSGASFASPYTNDASYMEPAYNIVIDQHDPGDPSPAVLDDPITLAVMRTYQTMYAYTETKSNSDYQTTACGYQSALVETPQKIPISI